MHFVIELLMQENDNVIAYFKIAKQKWREILNQHIGDSEEALAKTLSLEQFWFENNCGGRWEGQEIMVICGITQFYSTDTGFGTDRPSALRVYNAFMKSHCSLEVKGEADKVAKSYYLLEEE
jgi:hypothetical protein